MASMWVRVPDDFDDSPFLEPDVLYVSDDEEHVWYTPDGFGCIWYDSEAEGLADVDLPVRSVDSEEASLFAASR